MEPNPISHNRLFKEQILNDYSFTNHGKQETNLATPQLDSLIFEDRASLLDLPAELMITILEYILDRHGKVTWLLTIISLGDTCTELRARFGAMFRQWRDHEDSVNNTYYRIEQSFEMLHAHIFYINNYVKHRIHPNQYDKYFFHAGHYNPPRSQREELKKRDTIKAKRAILALVRLTRHCCGCSYVVNGDVISIIVFGNDLLFLTADRRSASYHMGTMTKPVRENHLRIACNFYKQYKPSIYMDVANASPIENDLSFDQIFLPAQELDLPSFGTRLIFPWLLLFKHYRDQPNAETLVLKRWFFPNGFGKKHFPR